ncbi:MAG: prepilin-type N-terminal cleavage/methylation domain-containing protein [Firmicutes bacterium]|nr:prepilin-type N-terminal cleavage/methylation domain-containing protein [Bacillota bacterium]
MINKKGFTLVELLAVIVILAIIIGIATPAFGALQTRVNQKQYENKIELIKVAALKYADDTNYVAFYVEDLVKAGYLEGDKKVGEDFQVIDNRDGKTIMNCYVITITESMDQNYAEVVEKNKTDEYEGCPANLPNDAASYFTVELYEDKNNNQSNTNLSKLTYDKDRQWWTKNNTKILVKPKPGYNITKYEWYKGTENDGNIVTATADSGGSSYYVSVDEGQVLQQNYIIKMTFTDGKVVKTVVRVYIDKIRPDFYSNNVSIPTDWVKEAELKILGYDNESGLYGYKLLNSGETSCPTDKAKYTQVKNHKITDNGIYKVCLRDNVGNISDVKDVNFQNIDNASIACNVSVSGTTGNSVNGNQWYIKDNITLTVKPNSNSVGPSGIYLAINDSSDNKWNSNWTSNYYDYPTYISNPSSVKSELTVSSNKNGIKYYGHTKNKTNTTNICEKNIYFEKSITAPTFSSATSTHNSITATYSAGSAISGIKSTNCYLTDSSGNVSSSGALSGNNCVFTVTKTSSDTTYYFKKCIESKAGNTVCSSVSSKANVGMCNNKKGEWLGTKTAKPGSTCSNKCGGGTQAAVQSYRTVSTDDATWVCDAATSKDNGTISCGGTVNNGSATTAYYKNSTCTTTTSSTCTTECGTNAYTIYSQTTQPKKSIIDGTACTSEVSACTVLKSCSKTDPCYSGNCHAEWTHQAANSTSVTRSERDCDPPKVIKKFDYEVTINASGMSRAGNASCEFFYGNSTQDPACNVTLSVSKGNSKTFTGTCQKYYVNGTNATNLNNKGASDNKITVRCQAGSTGHDYGSFTVDSKIYYYNN